MQLSDKYQFRDLILQKQTDEIIDGEKWYDPAGHRQRKGTRLGIEGAEDGKIIENFRTVKPVGWVERQRCLGWATRDKAKSLC